MKGLIKRIISVVSCTALAAQLILIPHISYAEADIPQMEYLNRGTVAVKSGNGVYLSWRLLGTENYNTSFDIYRDTEKIATVSDSTNYTDASAGGSYTVVPSGEPLTSGKAAKVWDNQYITIPLSRPEGGTSLDGVEYTYSPNDVEPADVDGDGEYELILKWEPSNSFDSGKDAHHNGNVYIDCYEMDGTQLWRIDMGININAGAHFTQIAAYDFDLDGKAEIALKTAPGTKDGKGNFVTEASSDEEIKSADNTADYRHSEGRENDTGGRVLSGPEYYTVFQGDTGEALDTIYYPHPRGRVGDWGDDWGNRSERYLTAVAYLGGCRPSVIAWRGYYAKTTAAAYNLIDKKLVQIADFDTSVNGNRRYAGNGNHNLTVGDIDNDGCDEIICGALALDNDLTVLWCSGRGHGDALHLADYDPTHEGMEYFSVHEDYGGSAIKGSTTGNDGKPHLGGMTLYAAEDGTELFHEDGYSDTGRGVMANVGYSDGYFELWGAGNFVSYGDTDVKKGTYRPDSTNFRIFWDGDLYDEVLDGTGGGDSQIKISGGGKKGRVQTIRNAATINGTKNNPCLQADLFGDWREELVVKGSDSSLLVYTTAIPTEHKLYTLMHDRAYRMQVASQNSAYNQPPHISYYVSEDNDKYDMRKTAAYVKTEHNGETEVRTANKPSYAFDFAIKAVDNIITVINKKKQETDAVIYTVKYDNNAVSNVKMREVTIPAEGYRGEIGADAGDTVFVWDRNQKPLAKSTVVKAAPTLTPTLTPTPAPTASPTPTETPRITLSPTVIPTVLPTLSPTPIPTAEPTALPKSDFVVESGTLIEYTGSGKTVRIPEKVGDQTITRISAEFTVFEENEDIETVIIPDTVTEIDAGAFYGCTSLKMVKLPESLEEIKENTFNGCNNLSTVFMPYYKCKSIGSRAFSRCASLKKIDLLTDLTFIDSEAFEACTALESISLPDSVNMMGDGVFGGCTSLKTVKLPSGLEQVPIEMFYCCTSLTEILLPETVHYVHASAFGDCTSLSSINLENITEISRYAFSNCTLLKEITLGENISSIGRNAFANCLSLKKITVMNKTIDMSQSGIENLSGASIYGYKGSKAEYFANYHDIPFYDTETGEQICLEWLVNEEGILTRYKGTEKNVIVPVSVNGIEITEIEDSAFAESDITSIELPDTVTIVSFYAFGNCASLKSVKLSSGMTKLVDVFSGCAALERVVIPSSVTSIEDGVFADCPNVTLYVTSGSYAEEYAKTNNINYVIN